MMELHVSGTPAHPAFELRGTLTIYDVATAGEALRAALPTAASSAAEGGASALSLDLSGIEEADAAGMQLLVSLALQCELLGLPLRVEALPQGGEGSMFRRFLTSSSWQRLAPGAAS